MAGIAPFPTNRCRTGSHRCVPETKILLVSTNRTFLNVSLRAINDHCKQYKLLYSVVHSRILTSDKAKKGKK